MDEWSYEDEFLCRKCKKHWYELALGHSVCSRCGNVTWPMKLPAGCLRVRDEVEV